MKDASQLQISDLRDMIRELIEIGLPKVMEDMPKLEPKKRAQIFLEIAALLVPRITRAQAEMLANQNRVYNPMAYINSQKTKYNPT